MKRFLSSLACVAILATGSLAFIGCQPEDKSSTQSHDELFGGGNGEFGESPANAGRYAGHSSSDRPVPASAAAANQ